MADEKVTQLVEETAPATSDLLYLVDDPGGTPTSKKATVANVVAAGIPDVSVRAYHDANQSIASNATAQLALNSERWDTDGFHDPATNNSRLTIPAGLDGKYLIVGNVQFDQLIDGRRAVRILLNGATIIGANEITPDQDPDVYPCVTVTTIYDLSATDYVELSAYQWNGAAAAVNVLASANFSPEFMLQKLG